MVLPPKELMIRLVFWAAVAGWAVYKIRDLSMNQVAVPELLSGPAPAAAPVPVEIPISLVPYGEGPVPDSVDPEAAFLAINAASSSAARCGVSGVLAVTLGPDGPSKATVEPEPAPPDPSALACLAEAVNATNWPRGKGIFVITGTIERP